MQLNVFHVFRHTGRGCIRITTLTEISSCTDTKDTRETGVVVLFTNLTWYLTIDSCAVPSGEWQDRQWERDSVVTNKSRIWACDVVRKWDVSWVTEAPTCPLGPGLFCGTAHKVCLEKGFILIWHFAEHRWSNSGLSDVEFAPASICHRSPIIWRLMPPPPLPSLCWRYIAWTSLTF